MLIRDGLKKVLFALKTPYGVYVLSELQENTKFASYSDKFFYTNQHLLNKESNVYQIQISQQIYWS